MKRGLSPNSVFLGLIIGLALVFSLFFLQGKVFGQTANALKEGTAVELQGAIANCRAQSTISGVQDFDQDKLADFCDPCVNGHDDQQGDGDFLADACDIQRTLKQDSGLLACCGDISSSTAEKTRITELNTALTKYTSAETQADKQAALTTLNTICKKAGHELRNVNPLQCCANSCPPS